MSNDFLLYAAKITWEAWPINMGKIEVRYQLMESVHSCYQWSKLIGKCLFVILKHLSIPAFHAFC